MSTKCEHLRELAAEEGLAAVQRDKELFEHFLGCSECNQFVQAIAELDKTISGMASEEPPESAVEALLLKVEALADKTVPDTAPDKPAVPSGPIWLSIWESMMRLPVLPRALLIGIAAMGIIAALQAALAHFPKVARTLGFIVELAAIPFVDLIEGALGGIIMVGSFFAALALFAAGLVRSGSRRRWRSPFLPATGFLTAAMALFMLRSMTSMYFGDSFDSFEGSEGSALIAQSKSGTGPQSVDAREDSAAFNDLYHAMQGSLDKLNVAVDDQLQKRGKAQNEKTAGVISMMVERLEGLDDAVKQLSADGEKQNPEAPGPFIAMKKAYEQGEKGLAEKYAKQYARHMRTPMLTDSLRSGKPRVYPQLTAAVPGADMPPSLTEETSAPAKPDELEAIGFAASNVPPPFPAGAAKSIQPGDTALIQLLSTVTAPADGTPFPAVFKLNGPITGPDGSSLDVGEARIIADAQATPDGRVAYRLTKLIVAGGDGKRWSGEIDGWIVGEDGIRGMTGKAAERPADFRPEPLDPAVEDASRRLTQKLSGGTPSIPVVEVKSGREVAAFFSKNAELMLDEDAAPFQASSPKNVYNSADEFMDERRRVEGVSTQQASGYWANTYVPGDPIMRLLQLDLVGKPRPNFQPLMSSPVHLDAAAKRVAQPFDAPEDSSLAVYLHSDRTSADAPSRMLVQVGIKGAAKTQGRRPPLNIGIVLDLDEVPGADVEGEVRALIAAFNKEKDLGDRFRIIATKGGRIVAPEEFKHGALTIALNRLFAGTESAAINVLDAVRTALKEVEASNDPNAPLGSNEIILVTARDLHNDASALQQFAHESAVAGTTFSVVGIGSKPATEDLTVLALAGQGSRRVLTSAAEAESVVRSEIAALSKTVARAIRLQIRLAPGVKLVDVLGSHPLTPEVTMQAKEAELSIDRRIARDYGIKPDRGEDDEGIQILIPAFYADDSHVILLDVVAPGPGPVADVTLRFKDLVHLKNGTVKAALNVERQFSALGPLQINVTKNLLAQRLSEVLKGAADHLDAGQPQLAAAALQDYAGLLRALGERVAQLMRDAEILQDISLLDEYASLLTRGAAVDASARRYLSDSLRLAGFLKLLPRPEMG